MPQQQPPQPERRAISPQQSRLRVERRADDKPVITGYAAVFYKPGDPSTEFRIWSDLVERIMPGAFDNALKEQDDARSFFNHNRDLVLGRVGSGTLRLSVDDAGLLYEVDPPDTQAGRDLVALLERGDVPGSSFMFLASSFAKRGRTVWATESVDGQSIDIREVYDLELFEAGPVMWPAYEGTTAGLRHCGPEEAKQLASERDAWKERRVCTISEHEVYGARDHSGDMAKRIDEEFLRHPN